MFIYFAHFCVQSNQDDRLIVDYGSTSVIPCEVRGHPYPKVAWSLLVNGRDTHVTMDTSQSVYANNRGELVIRRATSQANGEYVCHAKNIAGHAQMDITIQVISGKVHTLF